MKFQPQIDAEAVRNYWRSKAQTYEEPPEFDDSWPETALGTVQQSDEPEDLDETEEPRRARRARRPRGISSVLAILFAFFIGGAGGFLILDRLGNGTITAPAIAWVHDLWDRALSGSPQSMAQAAPPAADDGAPKPVVTATLDVADVQGAANSPIPLWLRAEPGVPGKEIALRLEGLPSQAWLTAGTRLGSVWLLRTEDLKDVKLMVPKAPLAPIALSVSAIEPDTGALASPVKELTVLVTPAADAPASQANFASPAP